MLLPNLANLDVIGDFPGQKRNKSIYMTVGLHLTRRNPVVPDAPFGLFSPPLKIHLEVTDAELFVGTSSMTSRTVYEVVLFGKQEFTTNGYDIVQFKQNQDVIMKLMIKDGIITAVLREKNMPENKKMTYQVVSGVFDNLYDYFTKQDKEDQEFAAYFKETFGFALLSPGYR